MPASTDRYPARVRALLLSHNHHIVDWVTRRVVEESDLDVHKLRGAAERYVEWSALVMEAVIANVEKRGWADTQRVVTTMANESLAEATRRPTDGPKGMPTLLKSAFHHNAFVNFLGNETARLVDANLEKELQTGLVVLGEARGQELYRSARDAYREVVLLMVNDAATAGEESLKIPAEPLLPLRHIAPGGRTLAPAEQRLTGHWVNLEPYSSGGFSVRVELHMILLGDSHAVRTSKSIAFNSLRDSSGNWIGSMDSVSGLSRGERGRWNADGSVLTLEMDDGSAYEYRYEQSGAGMVTTNTNGGARRYWTRERR